jgi:hypothetical protein
MYQKSNQLRIYAFWRWYLYLYLYFHSQNANREHCFPVASSGVVPKLHRENSLPNSIFDAKRLFFLSEIELGRELSK